MESQSFYVDARLSIPSVVCSMGIGVGRRGTQCPISDENGEWLRRAGRRRSWRGRWDRDGTITPPSSRHKNREPQILRVQHTSLHGSPERLKGLNLTLGWSGPTRR